MLQTLIFQGLRPECLQIREKVFVEEQGYSNDVDEHDDTAWHALSFESDALVGTARLYGEVGGDMFIGRLAVLPEYRGKGYGRVMMLSLLDKAKALGAETVSIFVPVRAVEFYKRLDFVNTEEISYDDGVAHVKMVLNFVSRIENKKSFLFVNACVRGHESRTLHIAHAYLEEIKKSGEYEIHTVDLNKERITPLHGETLEVRRSMTAEGKTSAKDFPYAHRFATADRILIAAPFWDMSFPAVLKCYIESVCVDGITFKSTEDGSVGACAARNLTYVTTRGFNIADGSDLEQAVGYMRSMCRFWGIPRFDSISAYGLDLCTPEVLESRMTLAIASAKAKAHFKI